jgi:hypothetical protein
MDMETLKKRIEIIDLDIQDVRDDLEEIKLLIEIQNKLLNEIKELLNEDN